MGKPPAARRFGMSETTSNECATVARNRSAAEAKPVVGQFSAGHAAPAATPEPAAPAPEPTVPAAAPESAAPAITVRGVGKFYEIYARPIDRLKQTLYRGRRKFYREFWALHDISFEVAPGESIGIIGRNGSGKSTLLQIIAGTLRPDSGEVSVRGRVHALLELGSGFNPEFTGRENVYLNGAVLGLPRREIEARFDQIADFADIGDFLDQPIKTYSTGMVVRLAFAVQALLAPDVLIVDEALSVGDEGFARKCYAWLENFRRAKGTLLFVTHNSQTVVQLCDRALLLDHGELVAHGASKAVVDVYQKLLYCSPQQFAETRRRLRAVAGCAEQALAEESDVSPGDNGEPEAPRVAYADPEVKSVSEVVYGTGEAEIFDAHTCDENGVPASVLVAGRPFEVRYRVRFFQEARGVRFGLMLKTKEGIHLCGVSNVHLGWRTEHVAAGQVAVLRFRLRLNVSPGTYYLNNGVAALGADGERFLHRRVDALAVRVIPPDKREIDGLVFTDPQVHCELMPDEETRRG